jgi:phosphatidylglycerophosphatase A
VNFARFLASGAGIGFAPVAPGTVASAVALPIGATLFYVSPWLLLAAAVGATIGGVWAIRAARIDDDPGWVVIDEFAGQWFALLGLGALSVAGAIAAFALFRVLDIVKPGPVGWADRRHDAVWVMADDVVAGVLAAVVLWLAQLGAARWLG